MFSWGFEDVLLVVEFSGFSVATDSFSFIFMCVFLAFKGTGGGRGGRNRKHFNYSLSWSEEEGVTF